MLLKQQTVSNVFNFYLCFHSTNTICRGLVVDKQRGNILKIDRHKSVRKAVHGSIELTKEQRKAIYNKEIFSFSEDITSVSTDKTESFRFNIGTTF